MLILLQALVYKWLIYHPYSLMGPCLKTQNPISILVSLLAQMVNGIIILMKYKLKLVEEMCHHQTFLYYLRPHSQCR
jgi:hypothetical protein